MQPRLVTLITVCMRLGAGVLLSRSLDADAGGLGKSGSTGHLRTKEGRDRMQGQPQLPAPGFCSLLCILGRSFNLSEPSSLYCKMGATALTLLGCYGIRRDEAARF